MSEAVAVVCSATDSGWTCEVTVGTDATATRHHVTVDAALLARLRPGAEEPDELVRDSFAFLLAREPRESILREFALPVIGRYFPEWESEIRR